MRKPISSLTGLRFAAAVCVLLSHAIPKIAPFESTPVAVRLLSSLSAEGISLFFVLSGFVIFYNYARTIGSAAGLWSFFAARFARLYPLYFVGMSYDLLMKLSYDQLPSPKLAALPYYATLTQSWFFIPIGDNALIYQFGLVPQISWSISTEWFFYLVFPLICVAIASLRSASARLWAAAVVSIVASAIAAVLVLNAPLLWHYGVEIFGHAASGFQDSFYRWLMYFSPYTRVFEFLLGCFVAAIFEKLDAPTDAEERLGVWLTFAALAAVALIHVLFFARASEPSSLVNWRHLHMNFGFAVPLAILVFCCARYHNVISRLMAKSALVRCGEASYSLYLFHLVVIDAFRYQAAVINSPRVAIGAALQLALVIASSIGLSLVMWFTIEAPARRCIRRLLGVWVP